MINITINNEPHDLEQGSTVAAIMELLKIEKRGTAVAVNDKVVPRSEHPNYVVNHGDRIEVIRAVGGG